MHLTADLTGKTAVVTGAARGIGEQTACSSQRTVRQSMPPTEIPVRSKGMSGR